MDSPEIKAVLSPLSDEDTKSGHLAMTSPDRINRQDTKPKKSYNFLSFQFFCYVFVLFDFLEDGVSLCTQCMAQVGSELTAVPSFSL